MLVNSEEFSRTPVNSDNTAFRTPCLESRDCGGLEAQALLAVTDGRTGVFEKPKPNEQLQQKMIMMIVNERGEVARWR